MSPRRGAMAIQVGAVAMILSGMLAAGVTIGQVAVQRQEQQTATDALAILCAQIAKTEGVPAIDDHQHLPSCSAATWTPTPRSASSACAPSTTRPA